jgi:hypothetical protein
MSKTNYKEQSKDLKAKRGMGRKAWAAKVAFDKLTKKQAKHVARGHKGHTPKLRKTKDE